jgi:virginiamycin B lyase
LRRAGIPVAAVALAVVLGGGTARATGVQAVASTAQPSLTEFPIRTNSSQPVDITAGSDGALWFTESRPGKIGRITTSGAIKEFQLPGVNPSADQITAGPDGAQWFTFSSFGNSQVEFFVGRITTSGSMTHFAVPSSANPGYGGTGGITAGPDGEVWFTVAQSGGYSIDSITSSGTIQELDLPGGWGADSLVAGPDGALWFGGTVMAADGSLTPIIGRMTTSGSATSYALSDPNMSVADITAGPDGALWFTEVNTNGSGGKIGRITTQGQITAFSVPTTPNGKLYPGSITRGPEGALWFTEGAPAAGGPVGEVARVTTTGKFSLYQFPQGGAGNPDAIATGSDHALWVTEYAGAIARLSTHAVSRACLRDRADVARDQSALYQLDGLLSESRSPKAKRAPKLAISQTNRQLAKDKRKRKHACPGGH